MKTVVALDPGKTTGVAVLLFSGWNKTPNTHTIEAYQLASDEVWDRLAFWMLRTEMIRIVAEGFTHRAKTSVALDGAEMLGIIKEFCRQTDKPLTIQTPSQAKHFFTDARLKEMEQYRKGLRHANDAIRHLLWFLNFGGGKELLPYVPALAVAQGRPEPSLS